MERLCDEWAGALTPVDDREIWDWVHSEGELPGCYAVPGRFDITLAPFAMDVFRALRDRRVRQVTNMSSVQSLKSLIGELWLVWLVANDPGPTQWVQPDDQEAKEHAEERFNPLIANFPAVHRFYCESRHEKKTVSINFRHMWLRMEGANNLGNAQRKSVKNQMCSEVHQSKKWKRGHLAEFGTRLTQFPDTSKRYIESQPGFAAHLEVDDMHAAYLDGSQRLLHFRCLKCSHPQPFAWNVIRADGSRAGIRWDRNERTRRQTTSQDPNEIWNWEQLRQTLRFECVACGHPHADEPITRRRMLDTTHFVAMRPDPPPWPAMHESFSWNQLAIPNLSWFENKSGGLKSFLHAHAAGKRGDDTLLRQFYTKVLAEPFDPEKFAVVSRLETIAVTDTREAADVIEHNGIRFTHRFAAIDVQLNSFWMAVEAWSDNGDSLTLAAEQLFAWEDCAELQRKWKVPDQNVAVDWSHRPYEVVLSCVRHGHWSWADRNGTVVPDNTPGARRVWLCWKAMRGSDRSDFTYVPKHGRQAGQRIKLPYTATPEVGDPCHGLKSADPRRAEFKDRYCQIITWSNPWIKDIIVARRDGLAPGIRHLTISGEWNNEYNRQMHSQRKDRDPRTGRWKWTKFRDDHLFDCKCMVAVLACRKNLLGVRLEPEA